MKYRKVSLLSLLTILLIGLTFLFSSFAQKRITTQKRAQVTPPSPETPATMADYWSGKAEWRKIGFLEINGGGLYVRAVGNAWYLFSVQDFETITQGSICSQVMSVGSKRVGLAVRKSTDKGKTWSAPVNAIVPQDGKPWECYSSDGSPYFDEAQNKWRYLFQCLARSGGWNGCYLEKAGSDPMGLFNIEPNSNPVITGRSIWSKICNSSSDHCVQIPGGTNRVYDEGTFDIIEYLNGYYYIGFHGYDGVYGNHGFRSTAKTTNFKDWIAGDTSQGVPSDASFDKFDLAGWREHWDTQIGPIGLGAGKIVKENGYYYQIIEGADRNLNYDPAQHWDFGIFRTNNLASTSWEQYPFGNPIIYDCRFLEGNNQDRCDPSYAGIFRDPSDGKYYLYYFRIIWRVPGYPSVQFFELTKTNNLLKNANLWKCNNENWNKIGATILNVPRGYPERSVDDNCYLTASCDGTSCTGDHSIFQDVDITPGSLPNVEFGGKFATDYQTGNIEMLLWEMDSSFRPLTNHKVSVTLNTTYQMVRGTAAIRNDTSKLRFQFYLKTPGVTFKADEMFIQPYVPSPTPTATPTRVLSPTPINTPILTPIPTRIPTSTPTRVPPTSTLTPIPCPLKGRGDANCDGVINILDFEIWRREFLRIDTTTKSDFDSVGGVSILDFETWRRGFLG